MITNIVPDMGLIFYEYKGDEIAWNGEAYYSILTCSFFASLDEMDNFWDDYKRDVESSGGQTGFGAL